MEVFTGKLHGCEGGFAFHQYGTLVQGEQTLRYEIVPGSGSGELVCLAGAMQLEIVERVHHYTLTFQQPTP